MDVNSFSALSLEEMMTIYEEEVDKKGTPIQEHSEEFGQQIYSKFFNTLNQMVYDKYRYIFRRMDFDTFWDFHFDRQLKSRKTSFSMIYHVNEAYESDYEPLVKFVIYLDKEKLNGEYLNALFEKISKKLAVCLRDTFQRWSWAMAGYYTLINEHYSDCLEGRHYANPTDDPDRYFLTHEILVL